jgi:cytochrome c peroxidase
VARRNGIRLCTNPLLDAWVVLDPEPRVVPAKAERARAPAPAERLGEALFYTTLMAPDASSRGSLSRFTCETCHFEGGTDGRVHNSGRSGVFVSTRPLFGLFNNGPHFSRAKDPDLTSVSFNEFVVANAGNPVDPFFALDPARFPFVERLGVSPDALSPSGLREALLRYLVHATYPSNPRAVARPVPRSFTAEERRGAELFRANCAQCHAARLVARDPATEIAFERWESAVLSEEGPIVWARADYEKVGVVPYVDGKGTRIPSLRRLFLKRPYFTNGAAATLADVLALARRGRSGAPFVHLAPDGDATPAALPSSEREALASFLALL